MRRILAAVTFCWVAAAQGVVDRVAVVVGNEVITESEVRQEVRLTEFLNGQDLDFGAPQRRAAAERLVDQQLIRTEMQVGGYAMAAASGGDAVLRNFRQQNYRSAAAFHAALAKYELTEEELTRHLLWQAAALGFTEQRFRLALQAQGPATTPTPSADRSKDTDGDGAAHESDDPMETWLKEMRGKTRIQFKPGAFQ